MAQLAMRLRNSFAVAILVLPCATSVVVGQTQTKRPKFDAFEVATIKPSSPEGLNAGRYIRMQSGRTFQAKNYTVAGLIAAAYDLTPRAISGGTSWVESDRYEIIAITPGDVRPTYDEQMIMLRQLLSERFQDAMSPWPSLPPSSSGRSLTAPWSTERTFPVATISTWSGHRMTRNSVANFLKVRLTNPEPDYLRPSRNNLD